MAPFIEWRGGINFPSGAGARHGALSGEGKCGTIYLSLNPL